MLTVGIMLQPGAEHTSSLIVRHEDTAEVMGSGDMPVLATPRMAALMENAAMTAVSDLLDEGSTTVGGHIDISHLKPTPVGAQVLATATLEKVEGRKLHFRVVAAEAGGDIIGEGTHLRFIVDREKFLSKIKGQK